MLNCTFCYKEIRQGERRYFSRQAGMKGHYHWDCFVEACRQANRRGAKEIQEMTEGVDEDFLDLAKSNAFDIG